MKQIKYIALLLTVALLATLSACTPEMDVEEPTLNIADMSAITFTAEGGEKSVTVETNQSNFSAIAKGDWVETTILDNTIVVAVRPYTGALDRSTKLYIIAGGLTRELDVIQSSAGINIITSPADMEVWPWEAEGYLFDVDVNTDNWEVEVNADWIQATARPWKKEVTFSVQANDSREDRLGTIKIIAEKGKSAKEFVVKQMGAFYFMLPYLDFVHANRPLIKRFEEARRSQLGWDFNKYYDWKTLSPLFPNINYLIDESGLISVTMPANKDEFTKEVAEDYKKYLVDQGFGQTGANSFFREEDRVLASIDMKENSTYQSPEVVFTTIPEQDKSYETFKELPLHFEEWGATIEQVKAYEAANGGTLYSTLSEEENMTPEEMGGDVYFFKLNELLLLERWYIFRYDENQQLTLSSTQKDYSDISLVYWIYRGEKYLTKEFKAFMEKGFTYTGLDAKQQKFDIFVNETKKLQMGFGVIQYVGEDIPHLVVQIGPYAKTGTNSFEYSISSNGKPFVLK